MTYESKDNEIVLFRNDRKEKDGDPDYRGNGKAIGTDMWVSGWVNESKTGTKYLKLKLRPKMEPIPTGPIGDIISDDVPF